MTPSTTPARLVAAAGLALALSADPSPAVARPAGDLPELTTEVAFPNLRFDRPVELTYPEDGGDLLFVVEQHTARIVSFPNDPETTDKQLFLDLPRTIGKDNEEGLLGLAFHPDYEENGAFFVYYSARNPRRSVVSRFRVRSDDPRKADPGSEQVIWESGTDPFGNHNGGCIAFGPDGYLYITLGDGGSAGDPFRAGQDPDNWFGTIMRIDVDNPSGGKAYGIPPDNPRLRDPRRFAGWKPEVFAIGLRNVWKFSFDRATGALWAGDVGQNKWEEIDLIVNGGNYGWNVFEGTHPFRPRNNHVERSTPPMPPVAEYPHPDVPLRERGGRADVGKSVTGGYVYRGDRLPELRGVYIFGDYDSGRVWGLELGEGDEVLAEEVLIDPTEPGEPKIAIASFAEDRAGRLYLLGFDGRIHRLARR